VTTEQDYRTQSYEAWERVAENWERRNEQLWRRTEPVSRNLVERLSPRPGETLLELACGVGQTGLLAAEAVGPEGRLIASDFSPAMLAAARRLADRLGVTNVEHRVVDAEQIDLPDGSVDAVLCRWGYMLVADRARAFAETRRVLKRDGRLAFAVWGSPDANPWAAVVGRALVAHDAMPAPEPGAPGMFALAATEQIEELAGGAGFESVEVADIPVTFDYESFEEYWTTTLELGGGIAAAMSELGPAEQAAVRADVERGAQPYRTNGGYELPGLCRNVLAR
jgi:ubiquinone/menaquinone biosynthesis C-methylase UbiE